MKFCLTFILFFVQCAFVSRETSASECRNIDDFWREYIIDLEKNIGLTDVRNISKDSYFRLWTSSRVIDTWIDGKSCNGIMNHWVKEDVPYGEEETERYFYITEPLDSLVARKIFNAYQSNVADIPTEEKISGWSRGLDGITYLVESNTPNGYNLKTYWTPIAQKDVPEAIAIQSFIDEVNDLVDADQRVKYFWSSIPFASWTNNGTVMSKTVSSPEYYRMKSERRRYLKSQKKKSE